MTIINLARLLSYPVCICGVNTHSSQLMGRRPNYWAIGLFRKLGFSIKSMTSIFLMT